MAVAQFEKSAAVDTTWPGLIRPAEYHLQGANTSSWRANNCQHIRQQVDKRRERHHEGHLQEQGIPEKAKSVQRAQSLAQADCEQAHDDH